MPRLEIYKKSLLYVGSILWNNLPVQTKETSSIKQFAYHIVTFSVHQIYFEIHYMLSVELRVTKCE